MLAGVHAQFCRPGQALAAGQGMLLPFVSELPNNGPGPLFDHQRDIFLFYHGGCADADPERARAYSWGKLQRRQVVDALAAIGAPDIDVGCACDICNGSMPHNVTVERMQRSRFCAVLAGDAQTSRRQAESVVSGCIPVYVGPGFHTLPFGDAVDHASFSLFFRVRQYGWVVKDRPAPQNNELVASTWYLDARIAPEAIVEVDTIRDIEAHLRALPAEQVAAKQAALAANFHYFSYKPLPGQKVSGPGQLVLRQLCRRAQAIRASVSRPRPPPPGRRPLRSDAN